LHGLQWAPGDARLQLLLLLQCVLWRLWTSAVLCPL
jgi:hypothetical protein